MGVIVNPLRSSVKSVGSMVKNVPENIFDGLKDGLGRVMRSRAAEQLEDSSKVRRLIELDQVTVMKNHLKASKYCDVLTETS